MFNYYNMFQACAYVAIMCEPEKLSIPNYAKTTM